MRTRKPKASVENEELKPQPVAAEPESASVEPESGRVAVSWYVKPDGQLDVERMRAKTRDTLRAFVTDPANMRALGIESSKESREVAAVFDEAWTGPLYDTLGTLEVMFAQKFLKVPAPIAAQVFPFNEREKKILAAPTAAVLNKYATDWMIRFKEEIALAMLLVSITAMKIRAARVLMDSRETLRTVSVMPTQPDKKEEPEPAGDVPVVN